MKHVIKILFLGISILFSFGFTTYQSSCAQSENTIEPDAHSCCKAKTRFECTQSNDCKADCCLKTSDLFVFNKFVIQSEKSESITVFESIKNFEQGLQFSFVENKVRKKFKNNYPYLYSKGSGRYIISLKQSWVI